ncbi:MAG: DEAD/DEAH box helicase [Magnetococcales bacterium]|nr:DEAD/DEAH box helicase [Magnetococcales bacterium]
MSDFSKFNLLSPLETALTEAGYFIPTPIQEQSIPILMAGRDLLGIAQTGTGKTAAFALPILDRLGRHRGAGPQGTRHKALPRNARVLILTPTRELASQIDASFAKYGRYLRMSRAVVYGGVGQQPQVRAMERGVDILVATPGRLLDLINQRHVFLDKLEIFVLDEADRMLDMGFINDIRRIVALLPTERQTLLFSATMPKDIAQLAEGLLRDPVRVEVTPPASTVDKVNQKVLFVDKSNKRHLLHAILVQEDVHRALVFTRTKHGADKVTNELELRNIRAVAIHGNKSQGAREKALSDFRAGHVRVLVATDIAARGIDVVGITHVINYDLPNEPESYVHRIGRTARANATGTAISFCDADERPFLRDIERLTRREVAVDLDHHYHSDTAANALGVGTGKKPTGRAATPQPSRRVGGGRGTPMKTGRARQPQAPTAARSSHPR